MLTFARQTRCGLRAGLLVLAAAGAAHAQSALPLAVCLPENDPPRSLRGEHAADGLAKGFDLDIARLLAARLERPLRVVWLPEQDQMDETTDLDYRPLLAGECDAALSVPGADAIAPYRRLALSAPYYGAAFEAIPADADLHWGEIASGIVAVSANSVAHVAVDALGWRWSMRRSSAAVAQAVATGEAAAGLVWGPDLALVSAERNERFVPPAVLRWNLHAATRADDSLLADIDRLFAAAPVRADVRALLQAHALPVRDPFATVHTLAALKDVADR